GRSHPLFLPGARIAASISAPEPWGSVARLGRILPDASREAMRALTQPARSSMQETRAAVPAAPKTQPASAACRTLRQGKIQAPIKRLSMQFDRIEGQPDSKVAWGSDVAAQMLRRLGIRYVSLNPGASYRGLHDSLVNHLGNEKPSMLLCLHEDHAVSIAHGYAKATGKPMG